MTESDESRSTMIEAAVLELHVKQEWGLDGQAENKVDRRTSPDNHRRRGGVSCGCANDGKPVSTRQHFGLTTDDIWNMFYRQPGKLE